MLIKKASNSFLKIQCNWNRTYRQQCWQAQNDADSTTSPGKSFPLPEENYPNKCSAFYSSSDPQPPPSCHCFYWITLKSDWLPEIFPTQTVEPQTHHLCILCSVSQTSCVFQTLSFFWGISSDAFFFCPPPPPKSTSKIDLISITGSQKCSSHGYFSMESWTTIITYWVL